MGKGCFCVQDTVHLVEHVPSSFRHSFFLPINSSKPAGIYVTKPKADGVFNNTCLCTMGTIALHYGYEANYDQNYLKNSIQLDCMLFLDVILGRVVLSFHND